MNDDNKVSIDTLNQMINEVQSPHNLNTVLKLVLSSIDTEWPVDAIDYNLMKKMKKLCYRYNCFLKNENLGLEL